MSVFDYPINVGDLLRKKIKIKRELLSNGNSYIEKKIAVLGGSTTNEIVNQLELFLLNYGFKASFYQSDYGQYWQDAMFGNLKLDSFNPDIVFIHTTWRNIEKLPVVGCDRPSSDALVEEEFNRFSQMWEALERRFHCVIIQNNFERPDFRLLGNRDIWDCSGYCYFISELNQRFYRYAQKHDNFYINDIDYLSADFGLSKWADSINWYAYKYAMSLDAIPYLAQSVANIIKSIYGKNKKLLVLDLDNTLWGGVVGDDGVERLEIGQETPTGQAYQEFQKYCKRLKDIGVVLAIDSKNERENAIAGLNHPDSVLSEMDFVEIMANWEPKDQNLLQLANDLSLGIDSFVFVDDNPAEREIVGINVPGVSTPTMDKVENFIRILDRSGYFETTTFSEEDKKKTTQYQARAIASHQQSMFNDYGEYLDSLDMKAEINTFAPIYLQRIAQLTNKTNQFNFTTRRYTEAEIEEISVSSEYIGLYGKLEDKFGDNGVVSVIIGNIRDLECHIDLWIMSCRILKRDMEFAMMDKLVENCQEKSIKTIYGYYHPTAKNVMVKEYYGIFGFKMISENENGSSVWKFDITKNYQNQNKHISIL